ncbi:hypothetical protein HZ994_09975 [Akkermansiaceae bacterium]|nr:hypothetical protein HZ994_09975 [Akkermansiaceae bacterium]
MNPETDALEEVDPAKPMHFAAALMLSFVIFNAGFVISQALSWSNHLAGFANGLIHSLFFVFGWAMLFIPWGTAVFLGFRKRQDKSRRTRWMLAPAWIVFIIFLGGLAFDYPTPKKRFERLAKVGFPSEAEGLSTEFTGGGFADYGDTYYFRTTSDEIGRIIREKGMEEDEFFGKEGMSSTPVKPPADWPDFNDWEGAKQYRWMDGQSHWFMYLITDSAKTQAYIFVGCT